MPTGYTHGIVEGKITTFEQFASICMRAMDVSIHMRDEPLSKPYEPREPSDFYKKSIEQTEAKIEALKSATDKELIEKHKANLLKDLENNKKRLKEKKAAEKRLEAIFVDTENWEPPTDDHVEFKKFMLQQLRDTMKWYCDCSYYEKQNEIILSDMDKPVSEIRKASMETLESNLKSHRTNWAEEVKRCEDANRWAELALESIKPKPE